MDSAAQTGTRDAHDPTTLARAATGDQVAVARLFAAQVDHVFALARMSVGGVGGARETERAVAETFTAALSRAHEFPSWPSQRVAEWLSELLLEAVARRTWGEFEPPVETPALPREWFPAGALDGVDDETLSLLLRSLPVACRQALALRVVSGLPRERVADALGVSTRELRALLRTGIRELRTLLAEYREVHRRVPSRASQTATHLKLLPGPGADGTVIVRGTRAYLQPMPREGLLELALRALGRLAERLRDGDRSPGVLAIDGAGGSGARLSKLAPTPTTQPIGRPTPTPSIAGYRLPEARRGAVTYRRAGATPSTERLFSPRRPLLGRANR